MAKDLEGKVFLITGATEGIGKAAAIDFAKHGALLTLVGRSKEKSERVVAEVKAASGAEKIELLVGDMSKLVDVRAVAAQFKAGHDKLDVLVNNAGAIFNDFKQTADGLEMTFALNHLGYFLLTRELLDLLKKTQGSRVVSTSSGAHMMGKLNLATVAKREGGYSGWNAYADSKLANVLFTRELAKQLAGTGVTANCFHPGFVQTGFGLNNGGLWKSLIKVGGSLFARTPEKGAETLIWLATDPEAGKVSGEYFHDLKVAKTAARAKDEALASGLWQMSEKLCANP